MNSNTSPKQSCSSTPKKIEADLEAALQHCRAKQAQLRMDLKQENEEERRMVGALMSLGVRSTVVRSKRRAEALRDYLLDHPDEQVTTRELRANPAKYGVVTTSAKLQLNWLYHAPTAQAFFEVQRGLIRLRPGITRATSTGGKP